MNSQASKQPKFYEIKEGMEFFSANKKKTDEVLRNEKLKKLPLSDRLKYTASSSGKNEEAMIFRSDSYGNKQMTFTSRKVVSLLNKIQIQIKKINCLLNFFKGSTGKRK
jgi:hypothetical protein